MSREKPLLGYELLDCGNGRKLERFGEFVFSRPSAQSVWNQQHPQLWEKADLIFERNASGDGKWKSGARKMPPQNWQMSYAGFTWCMHRNDFGHVGIFPEQFESWKWIQQQIQQAKASQPDEDIQVLNLFAYTGGSTLAAAKGGAHVVHLDASKTSVGNARENAEASGLGECPVRWLVEDVQRFVDREIRRERHYHGVILDPPTYGRGTKGEIWQVDEHIGELLRKCAQLLSRRGKFMLFSCHSPGYSPLVLDNLVRDYMPEGKLSHGEMQMNQIDNGRPLPSGAYARWESKS